MDYGNILKLDITLQKLSLAVVAVNLWELKSVKNKIYEAFKSGYSEWCKRCHKRWEIMDYVIQLVPLLGVPERLSEEIKNYLYIICELIFNFMEHITRNGLDVDFGMNICWAPYGRIDEVKMCRDFLKNSSEGQALEDDFLCLARIYTDMNLVGPNMRKIQKKYKESKKSSFEVFQHCLENDDLNFAVRYFWRELDIMKKQNMILDCAQMFLRLVLEWSIRRYPYVRQMKTELLMFFMGEMSEIQLSEFITENYSGLFEAFLTSWPYQELCGNIVDLYNNVNDVGGFHMRKCFDLVLSIFTQFDYTSRTYERKNVFNDILQTLLEKSPDKLKQKYFLEESDKRLDIFTDLADKKIWVPLSIMLNDGSLKEFKEKVLYRSNFNEFMTARVLLGSFEFTNDFLKYVLSTEEEIKLFKRNIDWINRFASEGNMKAADRVLNWACDTEKERKERREEVHPLEISKFIIQERYDIAEEFVNWLYDTEEERKDAKKMLYALDDERDPLKYCTDLFHKMEFEKIHLYITWRYSEEEEKKSIRNSLLQALEENHLREMCENLMGETRKYDYKDNIEKACFYLKLRFETEEERQHFKKEIYKSEEYLLEKYNEVLIPVDPDCIMDFDRTDYLNCFAMLKFFLETEEAVVEFETNNIFTEEFFFKNISNMPFKNFEEFLQFRDEMRKVIDGGKKDMSYEDICYQFITDRRRLSSPC